MHRNFSDILLVPGALRPLTELLRRQLFKPLESETADRGGGVGLDWVLHAMLSQLLSRITHVICRLAPNPCRIHCHTIKELKDILKQLFIFMELIC